MKNHGCKIHDSEENAPEKEELELSWKWLNSRLAGRRDFEAVKNEFPTSLLTLYKPRD